MSTYSFPLSTRIEFGEGYINKAGEEARRLGVTNAMVIADKGIVQTGFVKKVTDSLEKEGVAYAIYDQIVPNPRDVHCVQGAQFGKERKVDGLIAIGGGSSIDTAKAIGTLMTNGGIIRTWAGIDLLKNEIPPLIAIPTTAGTGSEVTFDAVITDTESKVKLNILDLKIAPKVALLDPQVLLGLPSRIMAACGVDALVHAIEAYTCRVASPYTDAFAIAAIDLICGSLEKAVSNPTIDDCRNMMLGSNMAGIAFGYSDVAAVHCIAEALGGRYDTPHGVSNAIVLPTVTRFNIPANIPKYANAAKHMGVDTSRMTDEEAAYSIVPQMEALCRTVGIPKMRELTVINPKDFKELARAAYENLSTPNNPRPIQEEDYYNLLLEAYEQ